MNMIKVLWMNNGDEHLQQFVEMGKDYDLNITTCKCMTDCRHLLDDTSIRWDAVMLNAEVKYSSPDAEVSVNNLYRAVDEVKQRDIPWFVITTKVLRSKAQVLGVLSDNERYYNITIEPDDLFRAIRIKVSNSPENLVKNKYANILEYCPETGLIDLLIKLEKADIRTDATILNESRKILEWIKNDTLFTDMIIPEDIIKELVNHNRKNNKELPYVYGELSLNDFSYAIGRSANVPVYVQRCFFACVSTTNPGSHKTEIDSVIKSNKAPYVTKSIIYDLVNILHWCSSLNEDKFRL